MKLEDIKEISYDYKKQAIVITLYEKINYKGFVKDKIAFKCDEKTFIEKCIKWIDFKNSLKNI